MRRDRRRFEHIGLQRSMNLLVRLRWTGLIDRGAVAERVRGIQSRIFIAFQGARGHAPQSSCQRTHPAIALIAGLISPDAKWIATSPR